MGKIGVPSNRYWGAQTQRSLHHFSIGNDKMPIEVIYAIALIKKCAAITNSEYKRENSNSELLSKDKAKNIIKASNEILSGILDDNFPLYVWQTGSGTQSNMNVNEVIANRANELFGDQLNSETKIHPNDHVNMSQSSNDVFPTAMHIAVALTIIGSPLLSLKHFNYVIDNLNDQIRRRTPLLDSINKLRGLLNDKSKEYADVIKIGRTHLQDAVPITFGQEISGWVAQLDMCYKYIEQSLDSIFDLAIGGTAVGTGLDSFNLFGEHMALQISKETGLPFRSAPNKFAALASHDPIVHLSGALKSLSCALMKIANDIRWLASGPRCGIAEIRIPEKEPGSSIMPGKVNPTQCEAMTMICCQVIGNDMAIGMAGSQGNFELNVYKPVITFNILQSIQLLSDVCNSFCDFCINDTEYEKTSSKGPKGLEPDVERMNNLVSNSLMLVTALKSKIGYDKAAKIAKKAFEEQITLKQATVQLGFLSEKEYDYIVNPKDMVHPTRY
ncbi:MAG: class II fumarate hydratase [Candidatus Nitrosocosmicus sp.]